MENPLFQWKVQWLPVDFPFNQPIDKKVSKQNLHAIAI